MRDAIIIRDLEMWPTNLGKMTWEKATARVAKLGPGWRLPTIEEFKEVLYPNRKNMPDIVEGEYYWSSTAHANLSAWNFPFYYVTANNSNKNSTYYVSAVRDFGGVEALDYLLQDF
jgi:hypothetical protein